MRSRIRNEASLTLKAETESRCNDALSHDGQMVERVVKAEREPYNENRGAYRHDIP
ncbi:hypothetical protein BSFA1_74250 (plasmid) [Burkholderia sp. SFA1]|nr:hypothetical protein BSFA1_74250 [Burkholderia sp. SFA1]